LCTLVFSLVGLKAPFLLGLICGVTNIIPYVGPYIGAIPAIIVAFSQGAGTGILVGVLILIIQTIEGNVIHPLVMSKAMKLHPVTILISLLIFEHFFGIMGMILAAPIVAVLKIIFVWLEEKYKVYRKKRLEE
jgi:predicted PurR-regulated permease PerM